MPVIKRLLSFPISLTYTLSHNYWLSWKTIIRSHLFPDILHHHIFPEIEAVQITSRTAFLWSRNVNVLEGGRIVRCNATTVSYLTLRDSNNVMIMMNPPSPGFNPGMSKLFHKRPCGCSFSFQPSKSTPGSTHLINWECLL